MHAESRIVVASDREQGEMRDVGQKDSKTSVR